MALLALPLGLAFASLAVILVAPFAWGAGDEAGLAAWIPTVTALAFGLPGLYLATHYVREVGRKTVGDFGLAPALLIYGLLVMPVMIATELIIAAGVADPATYEGLQSGPSADDLSPAAFLVVSVGVSLVLNVLLLVASASYLSAISEQGTTRYDRKPGESDGVGELLERHKYGG